MDNNVSSASENLIERKLRGAQNASEMEKGEKKVLAIGCADSRYVGTWLMNDSATAVACDVGGTMEGEEPGQEDQLNDQAKALLDRAIKEGIDVVAYFPHGLCGCVNNACACAHPDPHASSHAHGEEAHILSKMGARKKWAVDRVEKAGSPEAYLEEKNFKVPEGMSKAALLAFAVEIEHGLHQAKLIKDYMESKGSTAKVVVPYYDIKTNDTYLYIQEQGKFFKVTGEDAQKVPAEYAELAKTLKEGT
ncbi:MAG: hypothetical protein PHE27_06000, partial [Alphaproteobacteria bacterium]|nr:hypothetical protein [Alphaproteobacteria bacterium]